VLAYIDTHAAPKLVMETLFHVSLLAKSIVNVMTVHK